MIASAISTFPLSVFLAAALFVISYVMWETSIVYKLTASEDPGSRRGNVDCNFAVPTLAFQSLRSCRTVHLTINYCPLHAEREPAS